MISILGLSLALFCVSIATGAPAETTYTNKYDNFDVDKVLSNDRILTNYIKCLMDEGSCTNEGRELKKTIPDALAGGCSKCNEKQRQTSDKVINHVMSKRRTDWERLKKKYDPSGLYESKYKHLINKSSSTTDAKKDSPPAAEPAKVSATDAKAKPAAVANKSSPAQTTPQTKEKLAPSTIGKEKKPASVTPAPIK
uniref:Ejaculatory bulb-specific protein 3 n=1 Tax=Cacopsylla melanoneura TaxID=428564 RepID=A0A8D9F7K2_9HEMI